MATWCGRPTAGARSSRSCGSSTSSGPSRRSAGASGATACSSPWRKRRWNTACPPGPGASTPTSAPARAAAGSIGRGRTTTALPPWWRTYAAPARRHCARHRPRSGTGDGTGGSRRRPAGRGPPPLALEHAMGDAGSVRLEATPGGARAVDALDAAARGWSVIPVHTPIAGRCSCGDPSCPAVGKHARIPWKRRMSDAAGSEQVRRWWRRWPGANLGVVTGAVSGLVVLDIDPRNGGEGSLAALEDIHGPLPHTVESLTGGGGQHLYFRHPGVTVACHPIAPGLDVKGDGGMVVCPPSTHVSGRDYAWEPGCAPIEAPLAELPGWVLARARDRASPRGGTGKTHHQVPVRTMGERAEFATLWHHVGIELRHGDHVYLCPFHPDHHPSLHIDAEGCRFYCFGCGRGGGSGRLRRLVDAPRRPGPGPDMAGAARPGHLPAALPMPTLPGTTEVRVVGNYAHQDALLELTGGRRHYGGVRMETVARLAPAPENTADPAAIAVTIGGRTVGYLSHPDAVTHRPALTAAIERSGEASCPALIVGGWEREHGDVGLFGVRLRLGGSTAEGGPRHAEPPGR